MVDLILIIAGAVYLGIYVSYMISLEKKTKAQELVQEELNKMIKETLEEMEELRRVMKHHTQRTEELNESTTSSKN